MFDQYSLIEHTVILICALVSIDSHMYTCKNTLVVLKDTAFTSIDTDTAKTQSLQIYLER